MLLVTWFEIKKYPNNITSQQIILIQLNFNRDLIHIILTIINILIIITTITINKIIKIKTIKKTNIEIINKIMVIIFQNMTVKYLMILTCHNLIINNHLILLVELVIELMRVLNLLIDMRNKKEEEDL